MNERPLEVAQVVTRFQAGAGGVALRGALALDPARFRVTIVTGAGGPLADRARAAGLEVVLVPSLVSPLSPGRDLRAFVALVRLFRRRHFDVVHTHSAKAGCLGRLAASRCGVPLIVHTYHGFPFHDFQGRLRRRSYIAIERALAGRTDVVLAIGTGVATEALRLRLARPAALRTIPPVVEGDSVPVTPASRAEARARLGLPADAPVVGTVGRLDFQKAPEHFIAAIAGLSDHGAIGVWIGSGPGRADAERAVREHGLGHRFVFAGERDDVARLLPALDVFALSSRYEGLPCAVVEAMRAGLPVVATAVNSVPDLVVPGESGLLVPPGRPETLAVAIQGLLNDPDTAARLAGRGQELAGAAYDVGRLGRTLTEVYGHDARWATTRRMGMVAA